MDFSLFAVETRRDVAKPQTDQGGNYQTTDFTNSQTGTYVHDNGNGTYTEFHKDGTTYTYSMNGASGSSQTSSGTPSDPDYVSISGAAYLGVGGGITLSIDKWGNRYWSLNKGFGIGKGAGIVFGTILDGGHDQASVAAFLNADSYTWQVAFGAAGGTTTTLNAAGVTALEIGAAGPGFFTSWNSDLFSLFHK